MKQSEKMIIFLVSISLMICFVMIFIEQILQPSYAIKSALKLVLFLGGIGTYGYFSRTNPIFMGEKSAKFKYTALFAAGVYILILAAFFICKDYIDVEQIRAGLLSKEKVDGDNFIFVAAYISLINSFLEEAFFRGFVFLGLYRMGLKKTAYVFSAALFSLYHIGIITGWFNWYMYLLIIVALFAAGLVLNGLCRYGNGFAHSWVVHIAANLGINTIGFMIL